MKDSNCDSEAHNRNDLKNRYECIEVRFEYT